MSGEVEDPCEGERGEGWAECPRCGVKLKCKNLDAHLAERHGAKVASAKSEGVRMTAAIAIIVVIVVLLASVAAWQYMELDNGGGGGDDGNNGGSGNVTMTGHHTVLCEMISATWCPPCVIAEENMNSLYLAGDRDFVFLTLLADVTPDGETRRVEYDVDAYPTAVFDGGVKREVGAKSETTYAADLDSCQARSVPDVRLSVIMGSVTQDSVEASVQVRVANGSVSGRLLVYVVERASRYDNTEGEPIPNGVLDIERDSQVALAAGQPHIAGVSWGGEALDPSNTFLAAAFFDSSGRCVQAATSD